MNFDDVFREEEENSEKIEELKAQNKRDMILLSQTKSKKLKAQILEDINRRNQIIEDKEKQTTSMNIAWIFYIIITIGSILFSIIFMSNVM